MKTIGLALSALVLTGCASLMTHQQQTINVTASNNQPIEVKVDDKTTATPGAVTVLRDGKDKVVRTSAEGCDNVTPIKKSVALVFFGNIIIGGVLGSTTDASTGKMWNYEDNVVVNCTSN